MFNFPKTERTDNLQYSSNFLRTVIFQICYEENGKIQEKKEQIRELFASKFPRFSESLNQGFKITASSRSGSQTPILEPLQDNTGLEMKSQDGTKQLSITIDTFTFTISGDSYKNFTEMQIDLDQIQDFFNLCDIKVLTKIAIRKINVIDFLIGNSSEMEVASRILNSDLVSNFAYFPEKDKIVQNIHSISYKDNNYALILKYGLLPTNFGASVQERTSSILIDIDLINSSDIDCISIKEEGLKINNEIFNIFHWTLSKESKDALTS